jgi:hypothetical protein
MPVRGPIYASLTEITPAHQMSGRAAATASISGDLAAAGFCALAAGAVREAGPIRVRLTAEPEARPVGSPP